MKKRKQSIMTDISSQSIIDTLKPMILEERIRRIESVIANRISGIQLAMEHPCDPHNALAAVRSAEALGITDVHIILADPLDAAIRPVTQGAIHWVNIHQHACTADFITAIKQAGFSLAGGALHLKDPLPISAVPIEKPLCLVLGNEHHGLSDEAKNACDYLDQIPMHGMSESLNLSVSAAISLYDTLTRKRALLDTPSDLNKAEEKKLREKYYKNSVNPRVVEIMSADKKDAVK